MSRCEDLASRLDEIGEELDDLSLSLLHEAAGRGARQRPDADRTVTQARRAVEKAATLLRRVQGADPAPGG